MRQLGMLLVVVALWAGGCSGDGKATATSDDSLPATAEGPTTSDGQGTTGSTAPPTPPSTTYDPTTVEGQVEAAYLRAWEVFGEAINEQHPDLLQASYTGEALEAVTEQVQDLIARNQGVRLDRTFSPTIEVLQPGRVAVVDVFENHSVTFDRTTGEATEPDPDEQILGNYTFISEGPSWKVLDLAIDSQPLH